MPRNQKARSKSTPPSNQTMQSAARAASSKGRRRKARKRGGVRNYPPYVELMINPGQAQLESAHSPDSYTLPTIMWRTMFARVFTPDAQGSLFVVCQPSTYRSSITTTLDVGGVITAVSTGQDWTDHSTLASSFSTYRPVAMVVEAEYIGTQDTAKGVIFIAQSSLAAYTGLQAPALLDEPYYAEGLIGRNDKVCAIVRYPHIDTFYPIATAQTALPQVFVGTLGANAETSSIRVKCTLVNEYTASASSLMQTQALAGPSHPAAQATAETISGPSVSVASGDSPYEVLVRQSERLASLGARLNNLASSDFGAIITNLATAMANRSISNNIARLTNGEL